MEAKLRRELDELAASIPGLRDEIERAADEDAVVEEPAEIEDSPLYGVSLRQYAAIVAALAEGFSDEEVLRRERVFAHDWQRAERKWLIRFDEQTSLAERLAREMAAAEDWLWRDIAPVHEDAAAWAALYAAYSTATNRGKWLTERGLTQNDISRLIRHWSRRAATDTTLAERLALDFLPRESDTAVRTEWTQTI